MRELHDPTYTHPEREFSWRLAQDGDDVTVTIRYRGFPDDAAIEALDTLQRCAVRRQPRRQAEVANAR